MAIWGQSEKGSDLQKLALSITPLLDADDYEGIEKVLSQYKIEQKQKNQLPEKEKQEKESKILLQMREFYTGSHFAVGDLGVDPDKMSYKDFLERWDFMIFFRKDSL